MKEQELLHAIQNADRKYYEEAEARIHHRKEITMKSNIIRRIMAGTAVAAVLGVTALCGAEIYRRRSDRKIVNTVAGSTPDVQIANAGQENFLGGHGDLTFSAAGTAMYDSDNWYFSPYYTAKKTTDAVAALNKSNQFEGGIAAADELFLTDRVNGGLYTFSTATGKICAVDNAGTKTPLAGSEQQVADGQTVNVLRIIRLSDTKYYIDGYLFSQKDTILSGFWRIFDTVTGKTNGGDGEMITYDRVYPDGEEGVYAMLWNGGDDDGSFALTHLTEDKTEVVLNEYVRSDNWYVYDNCVYYRIPEDDLGSDSVADFYKYDMKTGEKTVVLNDCGFDIMVLSGGRVYTQVKSEQDKNTVHMASFKPDLTDRKDWTFSIADAMAGKEGFCYFTDVCGDCLILDAPPASDLRKPLYSNTTPDTAEAAAPAFLLYDMTTETVQSIVYEPSVNE